MNFLSKIIFFSLFFCMFMALLSSSQSAYFQCNYYTGTWGSLGTLYQCGVQNSVSITSLDAAQVDYICGEHLAGYNNDNVEAFDLFKGQIHYFPRGLNKFFKNLKGIQIYSTGLKEVHQSDLKDLPKLMNLHLHTSNLEILEKNLFEFNPNLDYIYLNSNKISHIDPNVFDKLIKLKSLYLDSNTCINMHTWNNPSEVQKIVKTARVQCTNSDYSNLDQKVKNLEIESKNLNSENLREKLEKLENEIKNSKFYNFFQQKLQDLKADQVKKEQDESTPTQKPTTTTTATATEAPKKVRISNKVETCSALESKIDEIAANLNYCVGQAINGTNSNKVDNDHQQNEQCAAIKEDLRNQTEAIGRIDNRTETFNEAMDTRMEILEENVENFKMSALREIQNIKNAVKDAHHGLMMSMNMKADKNEKKMEKLEEMLAKIVKALKIDD